MEHRSRSSRRYLASSNELRYAASPRWPDGLDDPTSRGAPRPRLAPPRSKRPGQRVAMVSLPVLRTARIHLEGEPRLGGDVLPSRRGYVFVRGRSRPMDHRDAPPHPSPPSDADSGPVPRWTGLRMPRLSSRDRSLPRVGVARTIVSGSKRRRDAIHEPLGDI